MRVVTLILGTLLLLASAGLGALSTFRGMRDAKDIDQLIQPMKNTVKEAASAGDKGAKELLSLSEKTGSLRVGAVGFAVAALAALALLALMYVGKGVPIFALGLVVVAIAATFISPQYDLGPFAPASARELGYVVASVSAAGALCAWGAAALRRRARMA